MSGKPCGAPALAGFIASKLSGCFAQSCGVMQGRSRAVLKASLQLLGMQMGAVQKFSGPDPVDGFTSAAKRGMGLDADIVFRKVTPSTVAHALPFVLRPAWCSANGYYA